MLSAIRVPEYVKEMYSRYKKLSEDIYEVIETAGQKEKIQAGTDLCQYSDNGYLIYIVDGFFKYISDAKLVRLYSRSDFIIPGSSGNNASLCSDFAADITVFSKKPFLDAVRKDTVLLDKWLCHQHLENSINRCLAGAYMEVNTIPDFNLEEYDNGDAIVKEGEKPLAIYEMVSGSAIAMHHDKEIGEICEGEIFGEISFLTECSRTATVIASERCMVRTVNKDDFLDMTKCDPQLIFSIAQTLAHRIVKLNDRVVGKII